MQPDLFKLCAARLEDLETLLDLYQHLTPGDERPGPDLAAGIFQRICASPGSAIFIVTLDGIAVASCTLIVSPNLTRGGRPFGLIENVVTHADYRGRGLGKRLLAAASEAAWDAGCYKLMLMTGSRSPAVLGFYQSAGFEPSKTGFQKRRLPPRADV
ncbi:MAG: GNAT family N-acetyltransferase [Paracoccus sp. (in: a-proteobacteria)]